MFTIYNTMFTTADNNNTICWTATEIGTSISFVGHTGGNFSNDPLIMRYIIFSTHYFIPKHLNHTSNKNVYIILQDQC